jgi:RNA polymerase sigma factor (TIGR02999 family)
MSAHEPGDISRLLVAWNGGEEGALEELIPIVYPELRRIARIHLARRASDDTLESAALVNEAYLKLVRSQGIECHNRAHFFAVCAQIIRRILVDHARNRRYAKRGGSLVHVSLDDALLGTRARGVDILALDEAFRHKPACGSLTNCETAWPSLRNFSRRAARFGDIGVSL